MNNAKMWLVVNPTVGVPLFLGAVAVGSFAVHVAVLSNTTWVSDFLSGKPLGGMGGVASVVLPEADAQAAAYLVPGSNDVLVTMPDGTMAHAVLTLPQEVAALN
jgi:light-harvesting protein B-800-850 alpha chain